ncbi:restriction endonuclease [Nitratireductor sp. GCM10026969]|uniref:restriction endonuclease n=1 Tax=Nitratireductor sp. GCM10026969 TaxID=3252645 RepID=UPI00360769F3
MAGFNPKQVRYIKFGRGGAWAGEALETGTVPFGYRTVDHARCVSGHWDSVRATLLAEGRKDSSASQALRELRDFYELGADCLWVTMANGHLWWAFAEPEVIWLGNRGDELPARQRRLTGRWRNTALDGTPLSTRSLSSALTRTAGYRMTVCKVDREDYLLRRIRGEPDPLSEEVAALQGRLQELATAMVRDLDWRDFEILVDLILVRGGWRRISAVGDGEVDYDLLYEQPTTGETAWVQVKTGAAQAQVIDYLKRFTADGSCERFFFICHSSRGAIALPSEQPNLHLWKADDIARQALDAGLLDWLMTRRR